MKHLLLRSVLLTLLQFTTFLPIAGQAQSTFTTLTSPTNPGLSSGTVDEGYFKPFQSGSISGIWVRATLQCLQVPSTTDAAYTKL